MDANCNIVFKPNISLVFIVFYNIYFVENYDSLCYFNAIENSFLYKESII